MGRPFQVTWGEDASELFQAYRAAETSQERMRLQALWLLRTGKSLQETAEVVGVHYRTVQQWVAWYREGGVSTVLAHRRGGRGSPCRLSREQQQEFRQQVARGAFRTAAEAWTWIEATHGVTYTRGGVYSLLRRLGARKKVPRPFAVKASLPAQEAWKKGGSSRRSRRSA